MKKLFTLSFLVLTSYFLLFSSPAFASCGCISAGVGVYECSGECTNAGANCKNVDGDPDPLLCAANSSPAGPDDCPEGKTYVAIFRTCLDFGEFAGALINWLMIIAAGLAIIKIAAGGIQYIFASGDPKNLENAHATMTSAIVGLMLVLLAWVIMKLIGELTPESWGIRLLGG